MVDEHRADYGSEWAAMTSIAGKIGCTAETLRRWCRVKASRRAGPASQTASEKDRLKLLEPEIKLLRRANEMLRMESANFSQAELDRQGKGDGDQERTGGFEPICRELAIAPSSYHEHAARLTDLVKRSAHARRSDGIRQQIKRFH